MLHVLKAAIAQLVGSRNGCRAQQVRGQRPTRPSFKSRLSIEPLEDRSLPATITGTAFTIASDAGTSTSGSALGPHSHSFGANYADVGNGLVSDLFNPNEEEIRGLAEFDLSGNLEFNQAVIRFKTTNTSYNGSSFSISIDAYIGNNVPEELADYSAPSLVSLGEFDAAALGSQGTLDVSAAYRAVVAAGGTSLGIRIAPTSPTGGRQWRFSDFTLEATGIIDVRPTTLSWDAVNGGADLSYTNSDALPTPPTGKSYTYSLYWANGTDGKTKIGTAVATGALQTSKGSHTLSVAAQQLGTPPDTATHLLLEVDSGGAVAESGEGADNLLPLAYTRAVSAFTAEYDGTGPDDQTFGRFFSAQNKDVQFPAVDQTYTVVLPDSIASLRPTVEVRVGAKAYPATRRADGVTYVTAAIDPGQNQGDVTLAVVASVGGKQQNVTRNATFTAVPLPAWVASLTDRQLGWHRDGTHGLKYEIDGKLLDLTTPAVFDIPNGVWLGGTADLRSELTASIGVAVVADLNPAAQPQVSGTLDAGVKLLGRTLVSPVHAQFPGDGPLQLALQLDGKTLRLESGTVTYTLPKAVNLGTVDFSFGSGGDKFLTTAWYKAQSQIVFTSALEKLVLSATVDTTGKITTGSIDVRLKGDLAGELVKVGINDQYVLPALRAAAQLFGASPPGVLASYLVEFGQFIGLIPKFDITLSAQGDLAFDTKINLVTGKVVSAKPTMNLHVIGEALMTWRGKTEPVATLDDILGKQFDIKL